jgi:tetratricopeptide (TPR) repeat protein
MQTIDRKYGLSLMIAAVLAIAGCGGKEQRLAAHLEKGRTFYAAGDMDKARVELKNVLQINPKIAEAYFLSGMIEEKQSDWQKAFGNYQRTIDLEPGHPQASVRLGRLYLLGGDVVKAGTLAEEILLKRPGDAEASTLKAAVLAKNGNQPEASALVAEVIARDPRQSDAVALLAGLLVAQGRRDEAESVLLRGIEANSKNVDLRQALISIYVQAREPAKAEEQFAALISTHPEVLAYRVGLAQLQTAAGNLDQAEATLRKAIEVKPDDDSRYLTLADFLTVRRSREVAQNFLVESVKVRPEAYALRFSLASLYRGKNDNARAEAVYRDIVEQDKLGPSGLAARSALAELRANHGRPDEAAALIAEVLKANPRDNQALMLRGRLAMERGDAMGAIGDYRAVLRDQPDSIPVITQLSRAHLVNGEQELARETLGKAVALFPDRPEVRMLLAEFKASTRDIKGAREDIEQVLKQAPQDLRAVSLKSDIEAAAGEWEAAEATLMALKKKSPGDPRIDQKLGNLYLAQKRPELAIAAYDAALAAVPGAIEPLTALSNLYLLQGKPQLAVARIEEALKATPENFLAQVLLGRMEAASKQFDKADAAFRKAVALNASIPGTHLELANFLAERGDFAGAERAIKDGLVVLPVNDTLLQQLAQVHMRGKNFDQAIAVFEDMATRDPGNDMAANNLASLLLDHRQDKASHERAKALARRFEHSRNPAYIDSLGWAYFRSGEYDRAAQLLRKAVEVAPGAAVLHYHLGMALHRKGDLAMAKPHLQKALDAKVEFPGVDEVRKILAAG